MRRIPLKTHEIANPADGARSPVTTADLVRSVCTSPLQRGESFDVAKMRRIFRIVDALDALGPAADALLLEDADWSLLRDRVQAFPFAFPHRAFVEFVDDVTGAAEVKAVQAAAPQA